MKLTPLRDRVVILPAKQEEMSRGGIIIPDTAKEKPLKGSVISVGKDCTLKVGDNVIHGRHAGTEIEVDEVKYLIMREDDVFAII